MSRQSFRLADGGRLDRSKPLSFTFDGASYTGYAGDTLASALLANGVSLVGRSFKYHRPRGLFGAGAEEPNAIIQLEQGPDTIPNLRATQVELYDGLTAASVNAWPGLDWDIGEINSLFSRILPAGFYYKTFMWPASFWMKYEEVIRRAAGLGRCPEHPDPDTYDKMHAHCDVLVVGGGPAGLMAAVTAGRAGARVILADEQNELGGALLSSRDSVDGRPGPDWAADIVAELEAMEDVTLLPRTHAAGYYEHNFLTLLERKTDHLHPVERRERVGPRQRLWMVRAAQVVLATGAIERPLVFADNDRPGIMLASAARTYVNRYGVKPGKRAVVFTNNDSAYAAAMDLADSGVTVAAIVDLRTDPAGARVAEARAKGMTVLTGRAVIGTEGRKRVKEVEVMALSADGATAAGQHRRFACDLVLVSGGWNPAVHLFSHAGGKLRFDPDRAQFLPGATPLACRAAGSANGDISLADCLGNGQAAGAEAAAATGHRKPGRLPNVPETEDDEEGPLRHVWLVPGRQPASRVKQFVDLQHDVTAADVHLAAREGYESVEHLKRYTTLGMGTDQGKTANINGLAIMAETLGRDIPSVGTTTFRPPYTPVTIGAMAGRDIGGLADPVRRTPMHHWHETAGALFEDVGQWKRPWYYPRPGESMRQALDRECLAARNAVGILDATTLGKIDIQGPDAAELLNRVYTNAWSKLEVGRCRYGLMLGEDGMVMDDGVTTRLGDHHYLMTTTTGNAARVLAWLEEWLQTEWPDLHVYCNSVTEYWATVSIAGPFARKLLSELCNDIDLSPEAFPFMALRTGTVAGIPARVFRISFTGEVSYEINVSSTYGLGLWSALMTAGEKYGITPYGTETMHILRAEKGYIIVGQDTDGTVTPIDLGMDWIVSKKKPDFIGRRSLSRTDTVRDDRKQLVGLLTENPSEVLPEGGQIVETVKDKPPMAMIGHVTSSYASANVGRSIALALIKGGRQRIETAVYIPLEDRTVRATVCDPVFFDPEGKRLHG
jgi:sarcosine oxidase subunit alpha